MKKIFLAAILLLAATTVWGQGYYNTPSSGAASNATGATVADTADSTTWPALFPDASGTSKAFLTDTALTYDASTGTLASTYFSGDGSGLTGIGATNATAITISGKAGETLKKGQAVYISGGTSAQPTFSLADNTNSAKCRVVGLVVADKAASATVLIRRAGELTLVDTDGATYANPGDEDWDAGQLLFLSTGGGLTKTRPTSGRSVKVAYSMNGDDNTDTLLAYPFENPIWITAASGEDPVIRMGGDTSARKTSLRNYSNTEVAYFDAVGDLLVTGEFTIDSATNAQLHVDRGASTNVGIIAFEDAGSAKWYVGQQGSTNAFSIRQNLDIASGNAIELVQDDNAQELTASSGSQSFLKVAPEIAQTGTAGYNGIELDVVETTTGSGTNNLLDLKVATVSKFSVSNGGTATAIAFSGPLTGAVTGNASTATALAADPDDCAAGQIATGIAASGALTCTATPSGLTSVGATTYTGALTGDVTGTASGNIPNTLADAAGDMIYASANDTWAKLTVGTTGQVLTSNGTIPGWSSSLSIATLDLASATSSVPWLVNTSTASNTTEGTAHWESDTDLLTIGDGATGIGLNFTANTITTFPTTTSTLARTDAGQTFTGVNAFTAPTVATSIAPASADGATLGTTAYEFSDLYLADGGEILFQNDQSVKLTPTASTLTLTGNFVTTGTVTGPTANDPYVALQETDGTDWWIGADDTGNTLEFRTNVTVGNTVIMELNEDGTGLTIGDNGDDDITLTFNANTADGTIVWKEDESTHVLSNIVAVAPQTINVTTEANLALTSSIVLIGGDNDSDSDTVDLQNGTIAGQVVTFIGIATLDADDTIIFNYADTTCTGCAAVTFDDPGDVAQYVWTGSTWALVQLTTVD